MSSPTTSALRSTDNIASVIRLVGAMLIDMHDEWVAVDRRYPEESMAQLTVTMDTTPPSPAAMGTGEHSKPTTPRGSV